MKSISQFQSVPFIQALKSFFEELQIPVNYLSEAPAKPIDILGDKYKPGIEAHKLIKEVYALGVVDDNVFNEKKSFKNISEIEKLKSDYDGLLLFGITLNSRNDDKLPSRNQLAEITRSFNRAFPHLPVTIVYRYHNYIALANSERTSYKVKHIEGEKIGKVSLLRDVNIMNTHAGHVRILNALSADAIREYDKRNKVTSFKDLYRGWQNVFNTSILNNQFYKDYQSLSVEIIRTIYPNEMNDKLKAHQGALNLLNRMMFIYFIQKKGWLMNDPEFLFHFWQDYLESNQKANTFHKKWLNPIFFKAFNGKVYEAPELFKILPEKYHEQISLFPYLNGGLFTEIADDRFLLNDNIFEKIFNFLQGYIFTISEDTAHEINLEINPELLGKMYEGMINATDLNDVDAEHGIVYTERPEINFMTRRSFVEVLAKKLPATYTRDFLYHLCFDKNEARLELLKKYKIYANEVKDTILSITALDPACGSGSMLIGIIQLQVEIVRSLDIFLGKPHTSKEDFLLKKQIISESIYGVDIKEWAVRIAELRFWLYMIAEAEFTQEELTKTPLLPNLDFKLRQGNSLLQQIGTIDFSLKGLFAGRKRNKGSTRRLNEFIKKKKEFITNQAESKTTHTKLKAEELSTFKEFIKELIADNNTLWNEYSKNGAQKTMFEDEKKENLFAEQMNELEKENEQFSKILTSIKASGSLPFSYDIDFMEIFLAKEDAGFDLIIGNPPYVRQEDILPAEDAVELERLLLPKNKLEKAEVNKKYKEALTAKVYGTYPFLATKAKTIIDGKTKTIDIYGSKVPGRSDLYVYFQLLCPALLNSQGTFCFIISNSWLDVEYGAYMQQFLLKHSDLYAIYDCNVRSFSASVNTIIYLHSTIRHTHLNEAQTRNLVPNNNVVKFVMNKADYTDIAYAPLLIEQEHCHQNTFRPNYRVIAKTQLDLWTEGFDEEEKCYVNNKWGGNYLSGPEIMYKILSVGQDKKILNQLKNFVVGERYLNTGGADGFFIVDEFTTSNNYYLITNNSITEEGKKQNVKKFTGKISKLYFKPLIKDSFKKQKTIQVKNTDALCFVVEKHNKELDSYIKWGENNHYHLRSVTQMQKPWYKPTIQMSDGALILVPRSFNEVFAVHYNPKKYLSLRFYRLHPKNKNVVLQIVGFLNSTLVTFFQETLGNKSLGQGALDFFMADFLRIKIPIILSKKYEPILQNSLLQREINSIFTELGFDKRLSIREQEPNPLPDRKELDSIIFDELGLTANERKEVYWATAELVKQRIDKANSR